MKIKFATRKYLRRFLDVSFVRARWVVIREAWSQHFRPDDHRRLALPAEVAHLLKLTYCVLVDRWNDNPGRDYNQDFLVVAILDHRETSSMDWGEGEAWEELIMPRSFWGGWWWSVRQNGYP